MSERPTRRQLLDLPRGERLTHGAVSACRRPIDPGVRKKEIDPREVIFSKHYLEGKVTCIMTDEAIEDILPDPWTLIEQRLDETAGARHAHHRDGSLVR